VPISRRWMWRKCHCKVWVGVGSVAVGVLDVVSGGHGEGEGRPLLRSHIQRFCTGAQQWRTRPLSWTPTVGNKYRLRVHTNTHFSLHSLLGRFVAVELRAVQQVRWCDGDTGTPH
jgi:hypothetical protein